MTARYIHGRDINGRDINGRDINGRDINCQCIQQCVPLETVCIEYL